MRLTADRATSGNLVVRGWRAFRGWRRSRPFWAGVWTILSGVIIGGLPLGALRLGLFSGVPIWAGVVTGAFLVVFGFFLWIQPMLRHLLGVMTILLALTSLITSNLGGLFVGLLIGLVGGSMAVAWTPLPTGESPEETSPDEPEKVIDLTEEKVIDLTQQVRVIDLSSFTAKSRPDHAS